MARLNAADVAAKWAANTKQATKAYEAGIQGVDQSPMEAAAAKADKYVQGVQDSVSSGKYQQNLRAVSLPDWKNAAITKGSRRITDGVNAAMPKMQQVMSQLLPQIEQIQAAVKAMPDTTEADREARMVENMRRMRAIRITKRSS